VVNLFDIVERFAHYRRIKDGAFDILHS